MWFMLSAENYAVYNYHMLLIELCSSDGSHSIHG